MKHVRNFGLMAGMLISQFTLSCSRNNYPADPVKTLRNDVVLQWNEVAYESFGGAKYQHSLMASRINAMVHIAMHDALNGVYPRYTTYAFSGKDAGADPVAAAATAAHTVLLHELPAKKGFLDSAWQQSLAPVYDGDAKERGIKLGKEAAGAIIAQRTDDGSAGNPMVPIPVTDVPGKYQVVPPFNFCFAPYWENLRLFGLQKKDQFRVAAPPALNSAAYATAFNEVKESGRLNSATRTTDQTAYAKFWYEFSEAGWNRVARTVAVNKKLNLLETARLFALVDIALADAYTAGWDSKAYYDLWRPYTAIHHAATDGNDQTTADDQWLPLENTPPVQDYPSTHSALGSAAATVMAKILSDNTSFTMTSPTAFPAGSTRSFSSFSQAAKENADSRVRAGIHFRFACEAGLELGNKIGDWIVNNYCKPLN
ncbi:vanadium-dependent haloperoxidase [Longitalea arenae]|uniref:vanadium-dependent haloperoxidase n=1 Tax=Longitalea arenae TaxID=2812558 RepID=UPI0019673EE5|nr:vanadium-dependent haloperoxidase [Longitalea arenae]